MAVTYKLYQHAQRAVEEIWGYTYATWGEAQADDYIRGLFVKLDKIFAMRFAWKRLVIADKEVFYIKYRQHFVFFRLLDDKTAGVIAILHEVSDIPARVFSMLETE
jgi:toxin ParE1/3/4